MARLVILMLLCVLPAIATARFLHHQKPFVVQGRVYCDTCRAGFETSATTYIPGMLFMYALIHMYEPITRSCRFLLLI